MRKEMNMMDQKMAKLLCKAEKELRNEAKNRNYTLNPEIERKLDTVVKAAGKGRIKTSFDRGCNTIDIEIKSYVFDSHTIDLKTIFATVDSYCIDSMTDGMVVIQMVLCNACNY